MQKQIHYKGHTIFYHVYGKGKPVVLVHGFGEESNVWDQQVAWLEKKYQLIIPDLPGSARSSIIDDMSMDGMADCIKAIVDTEQVSACTMIGHSMGGYITLAFAEKYPQYLNGFALFHSTSFADTEEKKGVRRKGIAFIQEHGAFEFLKTTTPNLFSHFTKKEKPGLIEKQVASLDNFLPQALVLYYEGMIARPDRRHVLINSKTPVLFILGEEDNAVPLADGLAQSHLPPVSYIYVLKKSGHMGMLEETDTSNLILDTFLLNT
jgi:pimeloyl-ACP methyl ester carboxylesterase